jgi:N utilization substance protein B
MARSEDQRREWTLWVIYAAELAGVPVRTAWLLLDSEIVGTGSEPSAFESTPLHRVVRFDDFIPEREAWNELAQRVLEGATQIEEQRETIDAELRTASPRWRIDRMPPVDRLLLRIGACELLAEAPRARATLNGCIELAKKYGADTTPKFINGILDQLRRNRDIPFA